ncbi:hypothetical protein IWX90DRAFT_416516 [Phyllosticta citrichinensis]|uniref:Uncharacterized protein n=1 Tax=Phyllosticta citrichinensis TaxID=1130410 RepID=A0ABR1XN55_9PEZI
MRLLAALFYNPAIQGGVGVAFDNAESPRERARRDVVAFAASIITCFDNAMREYSLTRSALLRAELAAKLDGLRLRRRRRQDGGGRGGGVDREATPRTYHFCFSDDSLSQQSMANSTDPAPLIDHHREGLFAEGGADIANYTPEHVYRGAGGRGYWNEIEARTETSVATAIPEIRGEEQVPARRTYDLSLSLRRRPNALRRFRDIVRASEEASFPWRRVVVDNEPWLRPDSCVMLNLYKYNASFVECMLTAISELWTVARIQRRPNAKEQCTCTFRPENLQGFRDVSRAMRPKPTRGDGSLHLVETKEAPLQPVPPLSVAQAVPTTRLCVQPNEQLLYLHPPARDAACQSHSPVPPFDLRQIIALLFKAN